MIVGFSGKLGAGKDFFADLFFARLLRCSKLAFADALKREAMAAHGLCFEEVWEEKSARSRAALQEHGVAARRLDEDHWVRRLADEVRVQRLRGVHHFLITDVRFPNELRWLAAAGGAVVRIVAPQRTAARAAREGGNPGSHASETALDAHSFEFTVHNTLRRPYLRTGGRTVAFETPEHLVSFLLPLLAARCVAAAQREAE